MTGDHHRCLSPPEIALAWAGKPGMGPGWTACRHRLGVKARMVCQCHTAARYTDAERGIGHGHWTAMAGVIGGKLADKPGTKQTSLQLAWISVHLV